MGEDGKTMSGYNYSDIKKQFRLLLAAINKGQQSIEFDWYGCCGALSGVANAKLTIEDFLDFQNMMKDVSVSPAITDKTVQLTSSDSTLKQVKLDIKRTPYPYFLWDNYIYSRDGRRVCHSNRTSVIAWEP